MILKCTLLFCNNNYNNYHNLFFVVELPKQVTVAIIKPDAVKAGLVDEIIQKVLSSAWSKLLQQMIKQCTPMRLLTLAL